MQFWTVTGLLILQCWLTLVAADENSQIIDAGIIPSVGTVNFKGSSLRIVEIDGAQVSEPRVSFGDNCASLRYNHLYRKYQLTLLMKIDVNVLKSPTVKSKKVGQLTLTKLKVKADDALASKDSDLRVMAKLTKVGEAQLIFLCDTFTRCQRVRDEVNSNSEELQRAVKFTPIGRVGSSPVKFGAIRSANSPKFNCPPGQWVVFQRRIDGSLSFAQNWDAYVKGFGNPKSNYWMGLEQLSAMTVTTIKGTTSRCELRIETEDLHGKTYWGQYKLFQVLDAEHKYKLTVGQPESGSQILMNYHNGMQFSTFDKDHDTSPKVACSQICGYGGWWYNSCGHVNVNAAYTTDKSIDNNEIYTSFFNGKKHLTMKKTLMKFRCH